MPDKYSISDRLQRGWNAFKNKDPSNINSMSFTDNSFVVSSSSFRPDRVKSRYSIDPTMINSIFTRLALDASASSFEHIKADENGGFLHTVDSGLQDIFTFEANVDQSGKEFLLDLVITMLEEGCAACVPIDARVDPKNGLSAYDLRTMRVGKITKWWPDRVAVEVYNDRKGVRETIIVMKHSTAIVTNPFYSIMNESNSTLRRLNKRLSLLDISDERVASSKLDMLIQLPYSIKNTMRENQAEKRRNEIVGQLENSEYGIAYVDGTEKIIQLNRPIENNLNENIELLTNMLFDQLGLSKEILNMTANEQAMINYYRRTIDPINDAIVNEFKRKFITKTARTQGQTLWHHTEAFSFTPTSAIADLADKLIRNEVLTKNEFRGIIGYKPSDDPTADTLANPNMPQPAPMVPEEPEPIEEAPEEVGSWTVSDLSG